MGRNIYKYNQQRRKEKLIKILREKGVTEDLVDQLFTDRVKCKLNVLLGGQQYDDIGISDYFFSLLIKWLDHKHSLKTNVNPLEINAELIKELEKIK